MTSTTAGTAHRPGAPASAAAPRGTDAPSAPEGHPIRPDLAQPDLTRADPARSGVAELELAHEHRDALVAAAARVTAAAGHDPDVADCSTAGCGLAALGPVGVALCAVAHRLSHLPGAPTFSDGEDLTAATRGFAVALLASADAIRACRQTAHAVGGCWFSPAPGIDGCGDVLRLLHRWG